MMIDSIHIAFKLIYHAEIAPYNSLNYILWNILSAMAISGYLLGPPAIEW